MISYHKAFGMGLCLLALVLLSFHVPSAASDIYFAQSAAGSNNGTSCGNAYAASRFNTSDSNWTAGNTLHLCGTITTALTAQGSGNSGSPITVQWETGASLAACSTTASLNLDGRSYLVLNLGANASAITCPNNGTGLSTQVNAVAIGETGDGWGNVEIYNGTIGPMYVYSGTANNGFDSACIHASQNARNSHIHHLTLRGCAGGISYNLGPTSSTGDEFDHITSETTVGRWLNYASAVDGSTYTSTNALIHDNDIAYTTPWAVAGDYLHFEWIHVYNRGRGSGSDHINNLQIYNNYFHGSSPGNAGSTGGIFISAGGSTCSSSSTLDIKIFNNLIVDGGGGMGFSSGAGGYIYEQDCEHTVAIYNNSIIGSNNSINSCFEMNGTTGSSWTVKNNICTSSHFGVYNPQSSSPTLAENYNDFYNLNSGGFGGYQWHNNVFSSLSAWASATGQDTNSITTSPKLSSGYVPNAGSPVIGAGTNLTSLGITALNSDRAGVARPASGAWGIGAYQYGRPRDYASKSTQASRQVPKPL